jgi:hypothetical protein
MRVRFTVLQHFDHRALKRFAINKVEEPAVDSVGDDFYYRPGAARHHLHPVLSASRQLQDSTNGYVT